MATIHQLLPSYSSHDAIGNHVMAVRTALLADGHTSQVFARWFHDAPGPVRPHTDLAAAGLRPDDTVIYHLSTGNPIVELLDAITARVVVDYHNVTPTDLFAPWEPSIAPELTLGRRQLVALARRAEGAIADSAFNASECRDAGYRSVAVVPIVLAEGLLERGSRPLVDRSLVARRSAGAEWLFVGRLAPNKAQHDIIAAFAAYRAAFDPDARLTLVGGTSSDAYARTLARYVTRLGLSSAVELAGSVSPAALDAAYDRADVFVCTSDHEGFCVPLIEAMAAGVPVVAYASTAVTETLGNAGILLAEKDPLTVAAAAARVIGDATLADRLRRAGRARLQMFHPNRTLAALRAALAAFATPA